MFWPFVSRRERLRREAAAWVARLNGPYEETDRVQFERWYRSDIERAAAYDRAAALFEMAGQVRRPASAEAASPSEVGGGRPWPFRIALAAAVAGAAVLAFVLLSAQAVSPVPEGREQFAVIAAEAAVSRRVVLVDGSEVLLSAGTVLDVAIGRTERRIRLVRGEGRFSVAHEERPFTVEADGTEVVARGTQFVVRLAAASTMVSLVEGKVDVSHLLPASAGGRRRVTSLEAGQQLVVQRPATSDDTRQVRAVTEPEQRPRPGAMLQFDNTRLGQAVEAANRHGRPRVRLGDPLIAELRVTGAFRTGDTVGFAESVAAAFDLAVERGADGSLWLRARARN